MFMDGNKMADALVTFVMYSNAFFSYTPTCKLFRPENNP